MDSAPSQDTVETTPSFIPGVTTSEELVARHTPLVRRIAFHLISRMPPSVQADATVTLALPKVGLIGSAAVGDLYLADLTIGEEVYGPMGLAVPRDLFAPGPILHLT